MYVIDIDDNKCSQLSQPVLFLPVWVPVILAEYRMVLIKLKDLTLNRFPTYAVFLRL